MKKFFYIMVIVLTLLPPFIIEIAWAEDEDYSKYPGFVDFSELEGIKRADRSVEIYLKKPLLSLVAALSSEEEEPGLQKLISNLVLIRVEQFEMQPKENQKVEKVVEAISKQLAKNKWEKLVRAVDHEERVEIYLKTDEKKISGLLVMALDSNNEAAFINIVGEIDLHLLGKLGRKFNIEPLVHINDKSENKENDE